MARLIPEDKINEIKNSADILDVISEYVRLKRSGKNYIGLCPFHQEKTPSFSVSPEKQMFHCFGCKKSGTVFHFLMEHENLSFVKAVEFLAKRYGIHLPRFKEDPALDRAEKEKERVYRILKEAARLYGDYLKKDPSGRKALDYLLGRGVSHRSIDLFCIGYAPGRWDFISSHFPRTPVGTLVKSGLVVPRANRPGHFDRFVDRIIFPILDRNKRVVGFGGRALGDAKPKYLNSSETPVFSKKRLLYGLAHAKDEIRKSGTALVVEGYMDVIALHQRGIRNAVATLGTSFTAEQLRLLKGLAKRVILVFDSDEAGISAAARSIDLFFAENVEGRILMLPEGEDPDSFIRKKGPEKFKGALERSRHLVSFLIDRAVEKHGNSIQGRLNVIAELAPPLLSIPDKVARMSCVKELAERIHMDEAAIMEKLKTFKGRSSPKEYKKTEEQEFQSLKVYYPFEVKILGNMLLSKEAINEVKKRNILNSFDDDLLKSLGMLIVAQMPEYEDPSGFISSIQDERLRKIAGFLIFNNEEFNKNGFLKLLSQFEYRQTRRLRQKRIEELIRSDKPDEILKDIGKKAAGIQPIKF